MRIDEALADAKPLAVKFGSAVLNVEYRPPQWTISQLAKVKTSAKAESDDSFDQLATMLMEVVIGWDLTRPMKVPDEAAEGGFILTEIPVDVTNVQDVKDYVPLSVINRIIKAVQEDNAAGEA